MVQGLRAAVLSIACVTAFTTGCATMRNIGGDSSASAASAIREADTAWTQAATATGLEGMMSYYAPDARLLPPGAPMAVGTEAIRKSLRPIFDLPGMRITWHTDKIEAARSGEIGYAQGTYVLTWNDAQGHPKTEHGKYVEVWKKQSDGSWKVALDMFSADAAGH